MNPDSGKDAWITATVESHEARLIGYAARILGDWHRARDAVQDVFVKLCDESPGALGGAITVWLFTAVRNRAFDIMRKEHRMQPADMATLDIAGSSPTPVAVLEAREAEGHLAAAVARLPLEQQEIVRLKFQEGFSYREIARITGHPEGTVGYLIHAAMQTLRRELAA